MIEAMPRKSQVVRVHLQEFDSPVVLLGARPRLFQHLAADVNAGNILPGREKLDIQARADRQEQYRCPRIGA